MELDFTGSQGADPARSDGDRGGRTVVKALGGFSQAEMEDLQHRPGCTTQMSCGWRLRQRRRVVVLVENDQPARPFTELLSRLMVFCR